MENLKPVKIKIFYDENLRKITGKDFEEVVVSEDLSFVMFLNFIFTSYPEITKRFIPGTLGILLNGRAPKENDVLKEGDKIEFKGMEIGEIRKKIEREMREIIDYYNIDTTFEEIKEKVFNETGQKDFNDLVQLFTAKIRNLDELNDVLKFVEGVWNYFPHKSLNGLCPMEKMSEFQLRKKRKS